jgi:hypothetical protein
MEISVFFSNLMAYLRINVCNIGICSISMLPKWCG